LRPSSPTVSSQPPLSPADYAACLGKRALSELVTKENAALLGFIDPVEASKATIGESFEIYIVDLVDLIKYDPATHASVTGLLIKMDSLIYPLLTVREEEDGVEPKPRSGLVVSLRKDKTTWTPTNWGLAKLVRDTTKYRKMERERGSEFVRVVWIPALNLHFLGNEPRDGEDFKLIPLANRVAYGLRAGVPILAEIVFALYGLEARQYDPAHPG